MGQIIGIFFVAVGVTGFTLIGADAWVTPFFDGGALMLAVFISTVVGRRRAGFTLTVAPKPDEAVPITESDNDTAHAR